MDGHQEEGEGQGKECGLHFDVWMILTMVKGSSWENWWFVL